MEIKWRRKIKKLKEFIEKSNNIVFFGGAGVSTESGVPDFRSTDGLYHQQLKYPPETILSHDFFGNLSSLNVSPTISSMRIGGCFMYGNALLTG